MLYKNLQIYILFTNLHLHIFLGGSWVQIGYNFLFLWGGSWVQKRLSGMKLFNQQWKGGGDLEGETSVLSYGILFNSNQDFHFFWLKLTIFWLCFVNIYFRNAQNSCYRYHICSQSSKFKEIKNCCEKTLFWKCSKF